MHMKDPDNTNQHVKIMQNLEPTFWYTIIVILHIYIYMYACTIMYTFMFVFQIHLVWLDSGLFDASYCINFEWQKRKGSLHWRATEDPACKGMETGASNLRLATDPPLVATQPAAPPWRLFPLWWCPTNFVLQEPRLKCNLQCDQANQTRINLIMHDHLLFFLRNSEIHS